MKTISFNKTGKFRQEVIKSDACIVEFKKGGCREVEERFLLINLKRLTDQQIEYLSYSILKQLKTIVSG